MSDLPIRIPAEILSETRGVKVINVGEKETNEEGEQVAVVENNPSFVERMMEALCRRSPAIARTVETYRLIRSVLQVADSAQRAASLRSESAAFREEISNAGVLSMRDSEQTIGEFRVGIREATIAEQKARLGLDIALGRIRDMDTVRAAVLGAKIATEQLSANPPPPNAPESMSSPVEGAQYYLFNKKWEARRREFLSSHPDRALDEDKKRFPDLFPEPTAPPTSGQKFWKNLNENFPKQ